MPEPATTRAGDSGDWRHRLALLGVLVAGLGVTVAGTILAARYRAEVVGRRLETAAREIESNLSRQAGAATVFVETVAAFFESSVEVSRAEFDSFVGRTVGHWKGLVAVEWQAWVPAAQRAEFEAQIRLDQPQFAIVERDGTGALVRAAERPVHLPIVHVFSVGTPTSPAGLDLAASQEWFETKLAAVSAPRALASPSFGIVSADGRRIGEGFSVSDSVLVAGTGPARERMRGFVSAVFAYRPIIEAATHGGRLDQVRVTVRDVQVSDPFYFSWSVEESQEPVPDEPRVVATVPIAGRAWEIAVTPGRHLISAVESGLPWMVLAVGLVGTGATVMLVHSCRRVRVESASHVSERLAIERRFRDVVDGMSGAVVVVRPITSGDGGMQVIELNAAALRLATCGPGEATGRRLEEVFPGAIESGLAAAFARVVTGEAMQRVEDVHLAQGGRRWHLDGVAFRVGQSGELCAVLQDLTDLKTAESALRDARDELELALDVSRVGLWSWDVASRRMRLDTRCARLFGLPAADVVEDSVLTARIHPDDLKIIRDEIDRAVRDVRSFEVEYRYTMPDGTLRYVCSRARPMREAGSASTKIVGCSWDVTERRRMEEHLRRTQRLESLGTLAGGVAHDLNNALAPVTMGLDLLKRRLTADPEGVESVKLMQTSVRRASSIVRQLIAFKRGAGESRQPAPSHPRRILEVLASTLVESFPREIAVVVEPASLELPRVVADEREMHQVLLNLCVNARDAMPQGGKLVVTCEPLEIGGATPPAFPELRPGSYVVFTITDTGTGIAPDIRHRVFDPFFTTKEVGKGSGLGLSTALGIVKAHRGAIQFESREGVGTTFRVALPTVADEEPPATVAVTAVPEASDKPARTPCLLLVDDESQVRELARRALEQSGFKVFTAANGREAVELFSQQPQAIDVVVMDLLMPVMNGAAATAAIKRVRPDVPIVGASGFATDALVDEARHAGITTFLPKPFTVQILVDAVRAAMGSRPG